MHDKTWRFRGSLAILPLLLTPSVGATPTPRDAIPPPLPCFAPGTPTTVVEAHAARRTWEQLTSLQPPSSSRYQFSDGNRWKVTATDGSGLGQGDPTVLTWSVVPDGTSIPGYGGEPTAPSNLRAFLQSVYGSESVWRPILQGVFDRWSQLTGIRYVYEPNDDGATFPNSAGILGVRGDVRISGHTIDGNSGVLAYNFYPDLGDMVLDTADGVLANTSNDSLILRNVLAHEHGHGLGLFHVCPVDQTKLMEPYLSTAFDGPQHDDILAVNRGYGDRFEEADSPGTATWLGSSPSSLTELDLSTDDVSDVDYYSFTVGSGAAATVTVRPLGTSYSSGPQNSNGSCSQGSLIDTTAIHDLWVELLDRDGTTVLASVDAGGPGVSETLANVALTGGSGTYYAAVRARGSSGAQLYALDLDTTSAPSTTFRLSVSRQGEGSGRVTSSPAGIDCGADCSESFDDQTVVTLTALAASGSTFAGWGGDADCGDGRVTMSAARSCSARFDVAATASHPLSISLTGNGDGTVTSSPAGIDCAADCTHSFPQGTTVTLTATPAAGSVFKSFKGDADCSDGRVTMSAAVSCSVQFSRGRPVRTKVTGSGRLVSSPAGIDCRGDCGATFEEGTVVELIADPDPGWKLDGWRGHPDCQDALVTLDGDRACHAVFVRANGVSPSPILFEDGFEGGDLFWWLAD